MQLELRAIERGKAQERNLCIMRKKKIDEIYDVKVDYVDRIHRKQNVWPAERKLIIN